MKRLIVPVLLGCGIATTLVREITLARYYGTDTHLEVFRIAFALPNMLGQGLAPVFIGAVLPLLLRAESAGKEVGFTKSLLRFNFLIVVGISLLGVVTAIWQARLMAPGFDKDLQQLLAGQIQITWFFFLGVGCSFGIRTLLNSREIFWPGASAGLVSSGVIAAGCLVAALVIPAQPWTASRLSGLAAVAGFVILLIHLIIGRQDLRALFTPAAVTPMRGIAMAVFAVFVYQALNTIPRFIDRAVATDFPQGGVAALEYSFNILTVPGILLATSFITVFYPGFVKAVERGTSQRPFIEKFLLTLTISVIIGLLLFATATPVVDAIYGRGAFDAVATQKTAEFLRWHGLGLPFMVSSIVLANGLLGHGRAKLLIAVAATKVVAKVVAVSILVPTRGAEGLAISFVVVECLTMILMLIFFGGMLRTSEAASSASNR